MMVFNGLRIITWFPESFMEMILINVRLCLPLTVLLITLCCMVRLDHGPVSYYINLLFLNLIQLILMVAETLDPHYYRIPYIPVEMYVAFAVASLCFRMNIALERCFLICQLSCRVTQTRGFVIVCVCVWVFSLVCVPLLVRFVHKLFLPIIALLPGPVFLMCLLWTLKSRKTNISESDEEKQGTLGILFVLLVNYSVSILPGVISLFYYCYYYYYYFKIPDIFLTLFLLSPCMDLILFVFMCKGLIAKLLVCLCCRKEASAGLTSTV